MEYACVERHFYDRIRVLFSFKVMKEFASGYEFSIEFSETSKYKMKRENSSWRSRIWEILKWSIFLWMIIAISGYCTNDTLPVVVSALMTSIVADLNGTAVFACEMGYVATGPLTSTCDQYNSTNGIWSTITDTCICIFNISVIFLMPFFIWINIYYCFIF